MAKQWGEESGGAGDGRVQSSILELLQSGAPCAEITSGSKKSLRVRVVPHTHPVPGSHQGLPGGLGGALSGRSSVTVTMDGSDDISWRARGIRVKAYRTRYYYVLGILVLLIL